MKHKTIHALTIKIYDTISSLVTFIVRWWEIIMHGAYGNYSSIAGKVDTNNK